MNAFHSGVGRMVAHSGTAVLPIAHAGLDSIIASRDDSCVIYLCRQRAGKKGEAIHYHVLYAVYRLTERALLVGRGSKEV